MVEDFFLIICDTLIVVLSGQQGKARYVPQCWTMQLKQQWAMRIKLYDSVGKCIC